MVNINYSHASAKDIPCKNECEDRHPGCHDKCERYISWKERMNEKRLAIIKGRKQHSEANAFFKSMSGLDRKRRKK